MQVGGQQIVADRGDTVIHPRIVTPADAPEMLVGVDNHGFSLRVIMF
jgi:hypothetical protein